MCFWAYLKYKLLLEKKTKIKNEGNIFRTFYQGEKSLKIRKEQVTKLWGLFVFVTNVHQQKGSKDSKKPVPLVSKSLALTIGIDVAFICQQPLLN